MTDVTDTSTDTEGPVDAGLRGQGWAAVAVFAAIVAVVVLTFAFSTHNTPMSVDGERATYSQYAED